MSSPTHEPAPVAPAPDEGLDHPGTGRPVVLEPTPPGLWGVLLGVGLAALAPLFGFLIGGVLGRQAYRTDESGEADRGLQFVVHLLEDMDRGASKRLLDELRAHDPELAEEVEGRLFTFENVVQLSDHDLQTLLRGLDQATIARALKGVDGTIRDRIFANISERAREMLRQEMEFLGPVLVRDVENAQRELVNLALELEQAGEITLTTEEAQYVE